ncbi:MAG: hypothetical protein RIA65_14890 [Woeseia sp.]
MIVRIARSLQRRWRHRGYRRLAVEESRRNLAAASGQNVLVMCYGNIYRSPYIGQKLLTQLVDSAWRVRSAGFHDRVGRPCSTSHVAMAAEFGVDLAQHRSARIDQGLADWADLIVIMDGFNRDALRAFSATDAKVIWAGAFNTDAQADIDDPYGRSPARIRQIVEQLDRSAETLAEALLER